MNAGRLCALASAAAVMMISGLTIAAPTEVVVRIENLAPSNGTYFTPVWVGFHNGQFDVFDVGAPASAALERVAEDGNTGPLTDAFTASGFGAQQDTITGPGGTPPVFPPGSSETRSYTLESTAANSRFFSYASMIVPSNDAFIGNGNPQAIRIFDDAGNLIPQSFVVLGSQVLDAGTEVNDETPANTAFFGQTTPDTGTPENGTVQIHPGYRGSVTNPGTPAILADPMFVNADFKLPGYEVARITIVPEPAIGGACALGAMLLVRRRR